MAEVKLVVLGGGGVGKSASVIQFIQNHFIEDYDPTIEDSYRKRVTIDKEPMLLDILDTGGCEEYSAMRAQYMRTGSGFVVMYSIVSPASVDDVQLFIDQIKRVKDQDDVPIVIAGNKCDLEDIRSVSKEVGEAMCIRNSCYSFYECSAKTRENIENVFFDAARAVLLQRGLSEKSNQKGGKKNKNCIVQ